MTNVVELKLPEPRDPHYTGVATCLACKYSWTGVAPIGVYEMECPSCGTLRGVWAQPPGVSPGTKVFTCKVAGCGCQHMIVARRHDGLWEIDCARCGYEHSLDTVFQL